MTNHPPAFQFYAGDWLADAKVQAMSLEAEGIYIRLLCYCWREGSIPSDRQAIARLCKGYDGPAIDEVLTHFIKDKNNSGRLINKRLNLERKKQLEYHKSFKTAGIEGAKIRWGGHKGGHKPGHKGGHPSSSSSSSSNNKSRDLPSIDIKLTQSLIDGILKNNPEASVIKRLTEKRKQNWIDQCRLLREADNRTPEQIRAVIQFSQADGFWKTNILSMSKLREKWDQLWLKAKAAAQGSGYKRDEGARYIKLTPAEEEDEKKLLAEYGTAQKKFMEAKGYKTEDDIPFDEYETFTDFKTRIKRERRSHVD